MLASRRGGGAVAPLLSVAESGQHRPRHSTQYRHPTVIHAGPLAGSWRAGKATPFESKLSLARVHETRPSLVWPPHQYGGEIMANAHIYNKPQSVVDRYSSSEKHSRLARGTQNGQTVGDGHY